MVASAWSTLSTGALRVHPKMAARGAAWDNEPALPPGVRIVRVQPLSIVFRYGLAGAAVLVAGFVWRLLPGEWEPILWFVPFLLAVAASAWVGGFGPGLVATLGAAWDVSHSLVRPTHVLGISGASDAFSLILFFGFYLLVSTLFSTNRHSMMSPF